MVLPDKASAEEARSEAGFSIVQWGRFINITAEEATKLRGNDPNITWKDISEDWRKQIIENVNTQLGKEKIPPVSPDVLKWRMRKAIDNRKYEAKKSAGKIAPSSAATRPPEETRPYDPVRDV